MKLSTSNILGVIPARFNSTRLSGKPLKLIGDKTMIEHVYLRANKVLENLVVATDDSRIYDKVKEFNGNVILTDINHLSWFYPQQQHCKHCLLHYLVQVQPKYSSGWCFR